MIAVTLIALAGCGGKDDDLDRDRLVPEGMRRTTVTMDDLHRPAPAPAPAASSPAQVPGAAADSGEVAAAGSDSVAAAELSPAVEFAPSEEPAATLDATGQGEPAAAPAGSRPAEAPGGAFVVQAGAYKLQATAEALAARLRGAGIAVRVEPVTTAAGTLHRVVVPGFADREAAGAMVARLKQELDVDAAVRTP